MNDKELELKIRYNSSAILYMLMILEKEPVSRSQLAGRLAAMGVNYTQRHINRRLLEAENLGFCFHRNGHEIVLKKRDSFSLFLMRLFAKWAIESSALRNRIVGTIDPDRTHQHIESQTVSFVCDLVISVMEGRTIEFNYKPQTEETSRKLSDFIKKAKSGILKKRDTQFIQVQMIPHYLVFSGSDFTILGETYFSKYDIRERQYAIAGISDLTLQELSQKKLNINPVELYRYSLGIWINGKLYDLEVEEKHPAGEVRRKKMRVNGEAEVLSYAASKLGNIKILNPPQTLIDKARETPGLCEMIFLQKDI